MSAAVWLRPMASSTVSSMDWGFTETRSTWWAISTDILSAVMVSGRPASTVYSVSRDRSKQVSTWVSSRSS